MIATIPLAGKPEFSQSDGNGKIYVNIEDKSSITVINALSLKVENLWPIDPGEEPSGLALDNENHRLFSVCGNQLMIVTDASSGKVITSVPIGEGTMTVIQQENADHYNVLENFTTIPGARTITLHKATHHLYLSSAEFEPGTGRRPAKPDTFKVLDIGPIY